MIDIIGSGIGGLTTAIALRKKGFTVRVFEQAQKIRPVGAGIILASNAMQVYKKLGLKKIIEENGTPISSMNITKTNLEVLSKIDLSYFEKKYKVKNIAIHRGKLQQILMDELKSTQINLNHRLQNIYENEKDYSLVFENGKQYKSSIIIGADGLNSSVRKKIFPKTKIRNANQICWRGVVNYTLPKQYKHELNEIWGKMERFGFVQIDENTVYWYALKTLRNNKKEFSINNIEEYFKSYSPIVKNIITLTPKEQINTTQISDLKPVKVWHKGRICLIGDAAHATTPNMGQGACQAIEDAYILSESFNKFPVDKSFQIFQRTRLSKAHQVVKTSWFLGKIAHLSNPFLIKIRNQIMSMTSPSINRQQSERIFRLENV